MRVCVNESVTMKREYVFNVSSLARSCFLSAGVMVCEAASWEMKTITSAIKENFAKNIFTERV
jgi:hypothetical protein